jgi:hypothetical protein
MRAICLALLFFTSVGHADFPEEGFKNTEQYYVWGGLGFFNGGAHYINNGDSGEARATSLSGVIALGGDFEFMFDYDLGLVATLRYYSTTEDIEDGETLTYSVFALGAQTRFHFPHKAWDFYAAPGLSLASASAKYDDETSEGGLTLAPTFTIGVAIALTPQIAVGVENQRIIALGSNLNGELVSDYLIKGRFSF